MKVTLKDLQARRHQAVLENDFIAMDAFDILIGHVLGEPTMYEEHNRTLEAARADQLRLIKKEEIA
jgi:hypothetical protein